MREMPAAHSDAKATQEVPFGIFGLQENETFLTLNHDAQETANQKIQQREQWGQEC